MMKILFLIFLIDIGKNSNLAKNDFLVITYYLLILMTIT